jgi:hypothetical protein
MGVVIKLLEPAKVYDINNLKASPIAELPAGSEIDVENILKAWKPWYKFILPDGRVGVISQLTKSQMLGYEAPKAGGWANFLKVLESANPQQYGYDLPDCIKAYEREIIRHIQTDKNPEAVILGCSQAGADRLLQQEVVGDDLIKNLHEKANKLDFNAINVLARIEEAQKRRLISDALIRLLLEQVNDASKWAQCASALYLIEATRNDGQLMRVVLNAYASHADQWWNFPKFSVFWKHTADDRIIDFLVGLLDKGFQEAYDDLTDLSISGLFIKKNRFSTAYYAAIELLEIGEERGVREIVPHLLEFVAHKSQEITDSELTNWCISHIGVFEPYLKEHLNHPDDRIRSNALYLLGRAAKV